MTFDVVLDPSPMHTNMLAYVHALVHMNTQVHTHSHIYDKSQSPLSRHNPENTNLKCEIYFRSRHEPTVKGKESCFYLVACFQAYPEKQGSVNFYLLLTHHLF